VRRVIATLGIVAVLAVGSPAGGQDQPEVRLILTKQSAFAAPDRPLRIAVAAENTSVAPLDDLTLTVAVYSPVRSRSEYDQTLEAGSTSAVVARTFQVDGQVAPGGLRRFPSMELRLPDLAAIGENALYPVSVELRSPAGTLAVLRTALVFVVEEPLTPLLVSLSFVLDAPVRIRPDGTFVDDGLERQVVPGGRLDAIVRALGDVPGVGVTLVVSPVLLEQLQGMRDGYRVVDGGGLREVPADAGSAEAAGHLLDGIREIARQPGVEVVALPYASPSIPALVHAGLETDLTRQILRGREAVAALLGKEPQVGLFRPPGSAVTASSLLPLAEALGAQGDPRPALLLDGAVLPPPPRRSRSTGCPSSRWRPIRSWRPGAGGSPTTPSSGPSRPWGSSRRSTSSSPGSPGVRPWSSVRKTPRRRGSSGPSSEASWEPPRRPGSGR
jgi:hypothetical protein